MNVLNSGFAPSIDVNVFKEMREAKGKPVESVSPFSSTERRFAEHFDTSSHSAVIKMMMVAFGPRPADMFSEVRPAGDGYDVTMKDGYKVHLSGHELRRTTAASRFVGSDSGAMDSANFALAVFVKRKQMSSADTSINSHFDAALSASLQGETTFNLLKGMGMTRFMRRLPAEQLIGKAAVGVMEAHDFGASLIRNGVAHRFDRQYRPDRPYVYVLDNAGQVRRSAEQPAGILNGFNAVEPRFGESFDASSHAAVIKMLMLRFGQRPADMFENVIPSGGGYDITMKDGFAIHLSEQELNQASEASRFAGPDRQALNQANFMWAAYVKRRQLTRFDPAPDKSFGRALSNALKGDTPYRVLKGLGMVGFLRLVPPGKMMEQGAVAVINTFGYSGALVLNGVQHSVGKPAPVARSYGYMLAEEVPAGSPIDSIPTVSPTSDVPVGIKPANIWSGFYQGVEGNCVTVSAIKAAMFKYGQNPRGIYKSIVPTREGYTVTMRDACTVHLTHEELKKAWEGSNFKGADTGLLKDATFLYAVSAKRAQMENHEFLAAASFEAAMGTLNDGESPGDALQRLGLYAFTRQSSVQELASGVAGTLANFGHSVAVVDGAFDDYGAKTPLKPSGWMRDDGNALKLV
jgi:hypothetical protein